MKLSMKIIPLTKKFSEQVERIVIKSWGAIQVAVYRELYDLREMPCIIAVSDGQELLGYCYYRFADNECEIMAIESAKPNTDVNESIGYRNRTKRPDGRFVLYA